MKLRNPTVCHICGRVSGSPLTVHSASPCAHPTPPSPLHLTPPCYSLHPALTPPLTHPFCISACRVGRPRVSSDGTSQSSCSSTATDGAGAQQQPRGVTQQSEQDTAGPHSDTATHLSHSNNVSPMLPVPPAQMLEQGRQGGSLLTSPRDDQGSPSPTPTVSASVQSPGFFQGGSSPAVTASLQPPAAYQSDPSPEASVTLASRATGHATSLRSNLVHQWGAPSSGVAALMQSPAANQRVPSPSPGLTASMTSLTAYQRDPIPGPGPSVSATTPLAYQRSPSHGPGPSASVASPLAYQRGPSPGPGFSASQTSPSRAEMLGISRTPSSAGSTGTAIVHSHVHSQAGGLGWDRDYSPDPGQSTEFNSFPGTGLGLYSWVPGSELSSLASQV